MGNCEKKDKDVDAYNIDLMPIKPKKMVERFSKDSTNSAKNKNAVKHSLATSKRQLGLPN